MLTVAVIIGTRPEAIKLAPVLAALEESPGVRPVAISTGQHREMLQQMLSLFGIRVAHDLAVMEPDQSLASLTARLATGLDGVLGELRPDLVLVQGDTTTAFAAALCAFYRRIPVAHVEAGLRSGDLHAPFPEEGNRKLIAQLSTLHFAPTERARENLLREGVAAGAIEVTGNTVIDALRMESARQENPETGAEIDRALSEQLGADWNRVPFVLVTAHRRESFGGGLENICDALLQLSERFPRHRFVYPVHLSPHVRTPVYARLGQRSNIRLIPPADYRTFVALMRHCRLVLTDSGGVQEEAPGLGRPVLVMRRTTERQEGVEAGTVQLVGTDRARIVAAVTSLLEDEDAWRRMAEAANPYGDGHASPRIVARIRRHFAS